MIVEVAVMAKVTVLPVPLVGTEPVPVQPPQLYVTLPSVTVAGTLQVIELPEL